MRFMGGKAKWGHRIAEAIEPWRTTGDPLLETMCGAVNVTQHFKAPVVALDANPYLIALWQACQRGWRPPPRFAVTQELHAQYSAQPIAGDPLTAFLLFGCSFRGIWRGGFCHNYDGKHGKRDYIQEGINHTLKKIPAIQNVQFACIDYRKIPRPFPGLCIYSDIPYFGTETKGIGKSNKDPVPEFNHAEFWAHAEHWTECGALVFVSEEGRWHPKDWISFKSWEMGRSIDRGKNRRTEHLFVHKSTPMAKLAGML